MGWWTSPHEFVTIAAQIENISRGGAKVATPSPPFESEDVWIKPGDPACQEWVRATVLQVSPAKDGDFRIRLIFHQPCPDAFFNFVTE